MRAVLLAFAISGAAALIYEITWIRPLQFIFGSTVYTVSIIFAAFMAGLSLGAFIASRYIDRIKSLPNLYGLIEIGIGLYGIALLSIFGSIPSVYGMIYSFKPEFLTFIFLEFLVVFLLILIPTMLMGATFPIIVKLYSRKGVARGIGQIYSVNNVGAIAGTLAAGFLLIPVLGIKASILIAASANLVAGSLILFYYSRNFFIKVIPIAAVIFVVMGAATSYNVNSLHQGGIYFLNQAHDQEILYYKEGLHSTVSVVQEGKVTALLINGKGQGSTVASDVRVNFLLSYLPILMNPESTSSLVIGLGTGTTSGILSRHTNTTTVEIEPAVIGAPEHFKIMNFDVLSNSNHKLVFDDARAYLSSTENLFDIISTEPSDPWQSFSTNLFSKEFYGIAKNRLSESGLYVQWVPIYTMTPQDFKSLYRTFSSEFQYVAAFENIGHDEGLELPTTELILVGSDSRIGLDELSDNYESLPAIDREYLGGIRIGSGADINDLLIFTSDMIEGYADSSPMVTDDNLRLEFSTSQRVLYQDPAEVIADITGFLETKSEQGDIHEEK